MIKVDELFVDVDKMHAVEEIRDVSESAYIIRMKRKGLDFRAGNFVVLGLKNNTVKRQYSIYSGENDPFIEVLIKEVPEGDLSRKLRNISPGEMIKVEGPKGRFNINETQILSHKFLFIATGTGISPIHSFVKSFPNLDYTILHGVRYTHEAYESFDYNPSHFKLCTSKDLNGAFYGRVTKYLEQHPADPNMLCYLCGNSNMIYDVFDILKKQGVPIENIFTEIYF